MHFGLLLGYSWIFDDICISGLGEVLHFSSTTFIRCDSFLLQVLAMKGLPPSQKEERGLDLKKKRLGSMADAEREGSFGLQISRILKNIPKDEYSFRPRFVSRYPRQHVGVIFLHRPYPDFLLEPVTVESQKSNEPWLVNQVIRWKTFAGQQHLLMGWSSIEPHPGSCYPIISE